MRQQWTREKIDFLRNNHAALPRDQLAEQVGMSRSAVQHKLTLLGLKLAKKALPSKEDLEELYNNQHISISQIAKKTQLSAITIKKLLVHHGFRIRTLSETILPKDFKKPSKDELEQWYSHENLSTEQIGKNIGVTGSTVRAYLREKGVSLKRQISSRVPNGFWTKDNVIRKIKELHGFGQDISARYSLLRYGSLFRGAVKQFGTWQKAIETAGIDYSIILRQKQWTKEEILAKIKELHRTGFDLSYKNMRKHHQNLVYSAERYFGNYRSAIIDCGIDYNGKVALMKNKYWTESLIIDSIKKFHENGILLSSHAMQKDSRYRDLFDAAKHRFGSWEAAINKAGLDYQEISVLKSQTSSFKKRLRSELTRERLESLYKVQGYSTVEIGNTYGVTDRVIAVLLRKQGFMLRRRKYGPEQFIYCDDGHHVKSNHERNVCNWLNEKGIPHEYEPKISLTRAFKADFKVGKFYIEIAGLAGLETYDKRFDQKITHFAMEQGAGFIWCNGDEVDKYKELFDRYPDKAVVIVLKPKKHSIKKADIEKQLGFLMDKYGRKQQTTADLQQVL